MSDVDKQRGEAMEAELGEDAVFVAADVTDYDQQASLFETVWAKWKRIDFVAANAGIIDTHSIYTPTSPKAGVAPPKPILETVDVDLKGAIYTVYLALHYFRQHPVAPGGKITVTASSSALYPLESVPLYSAAKSGVVGLVRAMAPRLKAENITINCLCPGIISTRLTERLMSLIPTEAITPIETVMKCYDRFINGDETGCTAEVSKDQIYLRDQPEYADEWQRWQAENLPELGRLGREKK
ncbi:hypothetical protein SAPIO_CDS6733 [Scedosporium apiospermum]|uniref:Uncharacterized protein n=1 Tax=Pseudallescheria apiosperma TaxID=563466 RepID=A0A084G346_PSEDA|nr:uncharacterized protein SAPIO_CDS6733 [Scedosporium apiospermum]KEZ41758.1 hypothetical protein SAPIO_CDS6733 [Scedosporium apiospermum]